MENTDERGRGGALEDAARGQPFVVDMGVLRSLHFSDDAVQTCMLKDDPSALIIPYTRKMMSCLLFTPAPRRVWIIGLGGGSLVKFFHQHLPRTVISAIEVDEQVIALRERFSIPPDSIRFTVVHADAADFVAESTVQADIILIDAFDADGVALSLAGPEFYRRVSECLTPHGVLVMNLAGSAERFPTHIRGLQAVFPALRLVPVEGESNLLLFAFRRHRLAALPEAVLKRRASFLEQRLGLEFPRFLARLRAAHVLDREAGS